MTIRSFFATLAVIAIVIAVSGYSRAASPAPVIPVASSSPNPIVQALQNVQKAVAQEGQQLSVICSSLHAGTLVGAKTDKRFPQSYLVVEVDCSLASYRIGWKRIGATKTQTPAPSST